MLLEKLPYECKECRSNRPFCASEPYIIVSCIVILFDSLPTLSALTPFLTQYLENNKLR